MQELPALPCPGQFDAPLALRTTIRVGGPARVLLEPSSEEELLTALEWTRRLELPLFVLGKGSNLVISDRGWPGAVLVVGRALGHTRWDGETVDVQAGISLSLLVQQALKRGLGGIEKLAGIPGTLGGALRMNAGAYGQEIGETVRSVRLCRPEDGRIATVAVDECGFGYRFSRFRESGEILLGATLALRPGDTGELQREVQEMQRSRKEKQPLNLPNAGSLFKRPPGGIASKMTDEAGLKGFRVGGAAISEKHAGFAVNLGGATAQDFWNLSEAVIRRVQETHGVTLEREIVFLGSFS